MSPQRANSIRNTVHELTSTLPAARKEQDLERRLKLPEQLHLQMKNLKEGEDAEFAAALWGIFLDWRLAEYGDASPFCVPAALDQFRRFLDRVRELQEAIPRTRLKKDDR